jgi:hypothetical protein
MSHNAVTPQYQLVGWQNLKTLQMQRQHQDCRQLATLMLRQNGKAPG